MTRGFTGVGIGPTPVHTGVHESCTLVYMNEAQNPRPRVHISNPEHYGRPSIADLTDTIRAIWTNRSEYGSTGDWLPLRALRARIASYEGVQSTREDIDLALGSLLYLHEARLIPESNQKTLTEADWDAAIWIGGQWHHLVSFAK